VTVVGLIALVAIRAGGLSHVGQHKTRYGLRLGLGVVAVVAAIVLYRRKPKPPDPAKPKKPSLIERLSAHPRPVTAFAVGVVMFGPSVTFIAAVQVVGTAKADLADTIGAMAMIIVLTVAFAWLPLVAYLIAPRRTVSALRAVDGWLKRHGKTMLTVAVGVVGILLVIQGITGLA
jgi:arginine exporter protein ArgO